MLNPTSLLILLPMIHYKVVIPNQTLGWYSLASELPLLASSFLGWYSLACYFTGKNLLSLATHTQSYLKQ